MVVKSAFESFGCFFRMFVASFFVYLRMFAFCVFLSAVFKGWVDYPKMQLDYSICIYLQHIYLWRGVHSQPLHSLLSEPPVLVSILDFQCVNILNTRHVKFYGSMWLICIYAYILLIIRICFMLFFWTMIMLAKLHDQTILRNAASDWFGLSGSYTNAMAKTCATKIHAKPVLQ